jgi:hypothetical protein
MVMTVNPLQAVITPSFIYLERKMRVVIKAEEWLLNSILQQGKNRQVLMTFNPVKSSETTPELSEQP